MFISRAGQIDKSKSVEELIADKQNDHLDQVYRPIPFHNAQAMLLANVVPGPGVVNNNPFAKVDGNGFYWDVMAVWPGTTTPGIPTGLPGLTFWVYPLISFKRYLMP